MSKGEPVKWITVRGSRVPIFDGQSTEDAIKSFVDNKKQINKPKDKEAQLDNKISKQYPADKRKRLDYEDDVALVYNQNGEQIYKGIEDDNPMKNGSGDSDWSWNSSKNYYEITVNGKKYIKFGI